MLKNMQNLLLIWILLSKNSQNTRIPSLVTFNFFNCHKAFLYLQGFFKKLFLICHNNKIVLFQMHLFHQNIISIIIIGQGSQNMTFVNFRGWKCPNWKIKAIHPLLTVFIVKVTLFFHWFGQPLKLKKICSLACLIFVCLFKITTKKLASNCPFALLTYVVVVFFLSLFS